MDVRGRKAAVGAVPLSTVQTALAERRVLRLEYRGAARGEATVREIEPLGLAHYLDNWHLIAWCRLRKEVRDFRVDRIAACELLSEKAGGEEGFRSRRVFVGLVRLRGGRDRGAGPASEIRGFGAAVLGAGFAERETKWRLGARGACLRVDKPPCAVAARIGTEREGRVTEVAEAGNRNVGARGDRASLGKINPGKTLLT